MVFSDIPVPEVYKESADFRFFLKWFEICLSEIQYKTDNMIDLLDPLRCPSNLLWLLGATCGYKYDDRASVAFNRLVMYYFAKLITYRGSRVGITLAAEINLAQLSLAKKAEEDEIFNERLEDTSFPVNAVGVTVDPKLGYIDLVYYSEDIPTDICTEYVRPLGMYCFKHAGVSINARTKVSIDARLTNANDQNVPVGPAFIAHYRRADYASLQGTENGKLKPRRDVYYRNMDFEKNPASGLLNPGYRSLCSLQLSNNEHIVKALLPSLEEPEMIFDMGYGPQNVETVYPDNYLKNKEDPLWNLRLNRDLEESFTPQVYTIDNAKTILNPKPAVNPPMAALGDAISLNDRNTNYSRYDKETGEIKGIQLDDGTPGTDD